MNAGVFMSDQEYMARVQQMERKLYRIAHAVLWNDADCADAIQEAVFKGWMKRDSLREDGSFEAWLARILVNECRNLQRRQKLRALPLDDEVVQGRPDSMAEDMQLREALRRMPEKYRMPLLLRYLEGYALDDVGRILGIPYALAKSRMHQARNALRKLLKAGDEQI